MPAAPARAGSAGAPRSDGKRARRKAPGLGAQPLEQRILLTATLCLLAFGAVMVYSATSATSLLQGQGNGSGYLVKYLIYGAIGDFAGIKSAVAVVAVFLAVIVNFNRAGHIIEQRVAFPQHPGAPRREHAGGRVNLPQRSQVAVESGDARQARAESMHQPGERIQLRYAVDLARILVEHGYAGF